MNERAADKPKILVIEDDVGLARLQRLRLERAGYEVVNAATAREGLERLLQADFDLVVLDQMLPDGMSGLEIYRRARAAGRQVTAILVTAFSDEKILLQALRAGLRDFVPKTPEFLDHLVPAVARIVKEQRAERRLR